LSKGALNHAYDIEEVALMQRDILILDVVAIPGGFVDMIFG